MQRPFVLRVLANTLPARNRDLECEVTEHINLPEEMCFLEQNSQKNNSLMENMHGHVGHDGMKHAKSNACSAKRSAHGPETPGAPDPLCDPKKSRQDLSQHKLGPLAAGPPTALPKV